MEKKIKLETILKSKKQKKNKKLKINTMLYCPVSAEILSFSLEYIFLHESLLKVAFCLIFFCFNYFYFLIIFFLVFF
jgi:hypothetical protein